MRDRNIWQEYRSKQIINKQSENTEEQQQQQSKSKDVYIARWLGSFLASGRVCWIEEDTDRQRHWGNEFYIALYTRKTVGMHFNVTSYRAGLWLEIPFGIVLYATDEDTRVVKE